MSSSGLPREKHGVPGAGLVKGNKDDEWTGSSLLRGQAERVQPPRESVKGVGSGSGLTDSRSQVKCIYLIIVYIVYHSKFR